MPRVVELVMGNNTACDLVSKGHVMAQVHGYLGHNLRVKLHSLEGGRLALSGSAFQASIPLYY